MRNEGVRMEDSETSHSKKTARIIYLLAFLTPFAMVQLFYALCGIWPYGENSVLTGDMDLELVNFYSYFVNIFRSKNDFSYMLAKTLGGDYPGLAAYELHDPLLFILLLFPGEKIAEGIQFMFALQISLAGLSASILLNNRYRRSWTSLMFSTAYAFSSFFFGYYVLTMYFSCLAILPLVIFFFLEFIENGKNSVPYILFVVTGLTVLALDGFFLIRTGLSLLGEKTTEGADYGAYRNFPMNQLFAQFFSGATRNELMPLIYCSVAALFFALVYFISDSYSPRQKLANLTLLAVLFVSMWINSIDAVWHGFNNPEGFYWRYAYFVSILVVSLGYKGCLYLTQEGTEGKKALVSIGVVFAAICLYMGWLVLTGNAYFDNERRVINIILVICIAAAAVLWSLGGKPGYTGMILLAVVCIADMEYDARTVYLKLNADDGVLPSMEAFREDYTDIKGLISGIKKLDDGFYRIEKDFDRAVNDPAMFDYIGLSHDSSTEKDVINHYLTNFGFTETVYYTFYNGGSTSFADAVLGVRYLASEHDDIFKPYDRLDDINGYSVYKDQYALPMAYIAPEGIKYFSFGAGNTFDKQNRLSRVWDDSLQPIYVKADSRYHLEGASEPEPGHYVREGDEGYIVYDIHIDRELPLLIYFAAPHRQSGEVFVNGESYDWYFTENKWNVLYAGTYDAGEDVEIRMQILKDELEITDACFYYEDEEALRNWADKAQEPCSRISGVNEISSSHLMFEADVKDGEMVVVSIPYDKSWRVYCDGKKIETVPAIEMLMGLKLPPGEHEIEMKYIPRGSLSGTIVSLIGVVMLVVLLHLQRERPTQG